MANEHVARLLAVAERQHGVLTATQARAVDVSASQVTRLVAAGVRERCDVGVVRVAGGARSWLQDLQIALLRVGPSGATSHRAAGRLSGLEGLDRAGVEVSVPQGTRRRPAMGRVHVVRSLDRLTDTGFETRLLRILRDAGLPRPTPQHVLVDDVGAFVARFDAAYVDAKVGIEADSERWHMDRRRFVADRTRRAVAESLGLARPGVHPPSRDRRAAFRGRDGRAHARGRTGRLTVDLITVRCAQRTEP